MTVTEVALPTGTAVPGPNARARRTRTRARPMVTDSVGRVGALIVRAGAVTRADLTGSWVATGSPPALSEVANADVVGAAVDHPILRGTAAVWQWVIAVPATAVLYLLAFLLQHPARAVTATAVAGGLYGLWAANT